jgi:hypothetical protein
MRRGQIRKMKTEQERGKLLHPKVENCLVVLRCEFIYHTLIPTFPLEMQLPYIGRLG